MKLDPATKEFWVAYLSECVTLAPCPSLQEIADRLNEEANFDYQVESVITCPITQDFGLRFTISLAGHSFGLIHPSRPAPLELGWIDAQHHSDALRWEEFEMLASWWRRHPHPEQPLWALSLLTAFYVAPTESCASRLADAVRMAMREAGLFTETEALWVSKQVGKWPLEDFSWELDAQLGWIAVGDEGYSLRRPENTEMDFAFVRQFWDALDLRR